MADECYVVERALKKEPRDQVVVLTLQLLAV